MNKINFSIDIDVNTVSVYNILRPREIEKELVSYKIEQLSFKKQMIFLSYVREIEKFFLFGSYYNTILNGKLTSFITNVPNDIKFLNENFVIQHNIGMTNMKKINVILSDFINSFREKTVKDLYMIDNSPKFFNFSK